MEILTIRQLRQATIESPCPATVHVQLERLQIKPTKSGSEYLEAKLSDAGDHLVLRVWSDSPAFAATRALSAGSFIAIEGEWAGSTYGLEPKQWKIRELSPDERLALLAGPPSLRARQQQDFAEITDLTGRIADPRLHGLCRLFLEEYGERFLRTGAAREYHHARRGGLVEHVAQMMRSAAALCGAYQGVNKDLLLAGVLFHDCGKLWENCYERDGFTMPHTEPGELLGHIPMGIELVNRLWRRLLDPAPDAWSEASPPSESVRLHLLHLIGSHHGEHQFGSPVLPRTPEAILLHHIDNIDAKLEMLSETYQTSPLIAANIFERRRPLPGNPVRPLGPFQSGEAHPPGAEES